MSDDNKIIKLDEAQKIKIRDLWNSRKDTKPPTLAELVEVNFPGKDGRSNEGMATKAALSEMQIKANSTTKYIKQTDTIVITPEIETFIKNNANLTSLEIARTVFNNQSLTPFDIQSRAIFDYLKKNQQALNLPESAKELDEYKSPRNQIETVARINCFVAHRIDIEKLSVQQKKDIEATQAFLRDNRFVFMVNAYTRQELRDLFESSFIKYIYNKASDITAEETEQFLNLASSVVTQMESMAELNTLKDQQMIYLQNQQSPPKGLGDRIGSLESAINDLKNYQDKVIKTLNGERNKRIDQKNTGQTSMAALFEAFQSEKGRREVMELVMSKDEKVKEAIKGLKDMDGLIASIWGINSDEVVVMDE